MPRYALTLEYDGTRFSGWQSQEGLRTVQGELENALGVLLREPAKAMGASRTDKGVHALGQVAIFDTEHPVPTHRLIRSLSALLRPDIAVIDAREVPADFQPRFAATGKHYRYRVLNRSAPSPLLACTSWHGFSALDDGAMRDAADLLQGTHDFAAFRAADCHRDNTVRTLTAIHLTRARDDLLEMHVYGDSFLKYMVRIIAGTLVEIGTGRRSLDEVRRALQTTERHWAGRTAPPHGLTLMEIFF